MTITQSQTEQQQTSWTWQLEKMIEIASELEASSGWTWAHSGRVARYAVIMGKALRLDNAQMMALQCAALLHDVGKMVVPDELLNKVSKLSRDEWYTITKHPMASALMIKGQSLALQVASIARSHHEWFNGEGYPMGLTGDAIPLGARILSLADAYDAMSSDRPYRPALCPAEIMSQIDKGVGAQFDPVLVNRLRPLLETGLEDSQPVRTLRVITDDSRLVQQLWFALYPNGWEIVADRGVCDESFSNDASKGECLQASQITVTVIDGKCAAALDREEMASIAGPRLWVDPPDDEPGLERPLDLVGLLREIQVLNKPVEVTGAIRVILADPFQLFRQALKQGLESQGDIIVVAEASTPRAFRKLRSEVQHDVSIVASDLMAGTHATSPLYEGDVLLEEMEALAAGTGQQPTIVLVSDEDVSDSHLSSKVWQPGESVSTNAYIFRGAPVEVLIEAVRTLVAEFTSRNDGPDDEGLR